MEDNLQFERAEFDAPKAAVCGSCGQPMKESYFQAGGRAVCTACGERIREYASKAGVGPLPALKAFLFGAGAAVAGGAVYGGVMAFAHTEWGIISIGVGIIVGKAVRKGSDGVGGVFYQCLAAALTYAAIAGAYAFAAYQGDSRATPDAILPLALAAYRLPFAGGASNAIGLLIIAFGVWQAWRLNQGIKLQITGPHPINPPKTIAGA